MKKTQVFVFASLFVLSLIAIGNSYAQIDAEVIVGLWPLDEGNGNTAGDASENGRDGVVKGGEWEDGKFGDAINFAKGDTIEISLGDGIITNEVSIVTWLQFTDLDAQQNYFSIYDGSGNRYVPYKTGANELHFWSNSWDVASGVFVEEDTWYHVANVYDGVTVKIYVDGELQVSQAGAFALIDNAQTAWIATDAGGWLSACIQDEVGIFSAPLTENEVKGIMDNGIGWALGGAAVEPGKKLPTVWGTIKDL